MNKFSKALVKSLSEAADHAEGRAISARVHAVEVPDVRAIRRKLHLSQQEFAQKYRIPLPTLRNWEQGRRHPDAPATAYLHAIAMRRREISEAPSCDEEKRAALQNSRGLEQGSRNPCNYGYNQWFLQAR